MGIRTKRIYDDSASTTAGELDDGELATKLGVDLAERPYPEQVLW